MLYRFSLLLYAAVKRIWVLKHSGFRLPVLRATPQSNLIHIFVCEVRGGPPPGHVLVLGGTGAEPPNSITAASMAPRRYLRR